MSAIAGVYHLDERRVEQQNLARMLDILAHRGPDGADIWVDGSVGFGHRMLWTTPESLIEKLPLVNGTGDIAITSDSRIDNREELIAALELNNCSSEQITDSELILAAYVKWDEKCPEHLLGDFVFVIWDKRKQTLFCARDHMGVKPFYYYHQPGKLFVFGSEIKALLCLQDVPRRLNEVKLGDYLASNFQDKVNTFYQDIFRLPPASCLTLNHKGLQIRSYWSLDPERELRLNSDEEYAEALEEIFAESVRCRLRSAFPVGSHLSGGLDSSSVTCMARKILQEQNRSLHTFSNIFDKVIQCDERPYIESVLAQGGMIPHYVHGDELGPLSDLKRIFQYHDEVFFGPTHFLVWVANCATKHQDIRIVLDGFDGDTTISHGEGYFTELARKGQWAAFAKQADDIVQRVGGGSPLNILRSSGLTYLEELARKSNWLAFAKETRQISKYFDISQQQILVQHGLKPLIPQSGRQALQVLRGNHKPMRKADWLFNPSFEHKIGLKKRIKALDESQFHIPVTEREHHWRYLTWGLVGYAMETLDKSYATFSIEARHPFMDKRLVEFCLSLPPQQKLNRGWTRLIMRRAMENILPEQVQWRQTKSKMTASFIYGILNLDRKFLDDVMQNHLEIIAAYVDINALRKGYEQVTSTSNIGSYENSILIEIWKAVTLSFWLRHSQIEH